MPWQWWNFLLKFEGNYILFRSLLFRFLEFIKPVHHAEIITIGWIVHYCYSTVPPVTLLSSCEENYIKKNITLNIVMRRTSTRNNIKNKFWKVSKKRTTEIWTWAELNMSCQLSHIDFSLSQRLQIVQLYYQNLRSTKNVFHALVVHNQLADAQFARHSVNLKINFYYWIHATKHTTSRPME